MAQALQFTKANSTLSVIDGGGTQWALTGVCTLKMIPGDVSGSTKKADYTLSCTDEVIRFNQQDILKIAGSDPSGTPATDFASLKALLPLYA